MQIMNKDEWVKNMNERMGRDSHYLARTIHKPRREVGEMPVMARKTSEYVTAWAMTSQG
jgi:hypothetical protein